MLRVFHCSAGVNVVRLKVVTVEMVLYLYSIKLSHYYYYSPLSSLLLNLQGLAQPLGLNKHLWNERLNQSTLVLVLPSPWTSHSESQFPHLQARVTNPHLTVFPELNEQIRICILRTVECSTDAVHSHALPPLLGCGWQQTRDSDGEAALN